MAFVSSMMFSQLGIVDAVRNLAELGFRRVELSHVHLERIDASEENVRSLARRIRELGVDARVAHLPADRAATIVECSGCWRKCFERVRVFAEILPTILGTEILVVHTLLPKPRPEASCIENAEVSERETRRFLEALDRLAREIGFAIAVENRVEKYAFGHSLGDLLRVIEGLENVGLCIDVGHAHASGLNPLEMIKLARDRTLVYHLHDNDGSRDQHLLPYLGSIPWSDIVRELNSSAAIVFEVSCSSRPEVCRSYARYLSMFIKVMNLQRAEG